LSLSKLARRRSIWRCNIASDVTCLLVGDEIRLRQVLLNLIGNAVKFTEKGSVLVTAKVIDDNDNDVIAEFRVKDSGIGIAQEDIQHIFSEFTQVDHSSTRKFEGTGLGLAISRKLINLMGGTIEVESRLGEGAEFRFSIRFEKALEHQTVPNQAPLHGDETENNFLMEVETAASIKRDQNSVNNAERRILLADDNLVNLEVALAMLDVMAYKTDAVSDGKQALNMALSDDYDLILMDCHMPGMSGFDVTAAIRDNESKVRKARVPIIALTADVEAGIWKQCENAGMDGYLSKPFSQHELSEIIDQWMYS
jgi:CheY-like chemotaxis protein